MPCERSTGAGDSSPLCIAEPAGGCPAMAEERTDEGKWPAVPEEGAESEPCAAVSERRTDAQECPAETDERRRAGGWPAVAEEQAEAEEGAVESGERAEAQGWSAVAESQGTPGECPAVPGERGACYFGRHVGPVRRTRFAVALQLSRGVPLLIAILAAAVSGDAARVRKSTLCLAELVLDGARDRGQGPLRRTRFDQEDRRGPLRRPRPARDRSASTRGKKDRRNKRKGESPSAQPQPT